MYKFFNYMIYIGFLKLSKNSSICHLVAFFRDKREVFSADPQVYPQPLWMTRISSVSTIG